MKLSEGVKQPFLFTSENFKPAQGKRSCKILDILQEKGHFPYKILAPCKFLTRFLLLTYKKHEVSCTILARKGTYSVHIQCTERARTCKIFFPGCIPFPVVFMDL